MNCDLLDRDELDNEGSLGVITRAGKERLRVLKTPRRVGGRMMMRVCLSTTQPVAGCT